MIRPLGSLLIGCLAFWAVATGLIYLCWDQFALTEAAFPRGVAVLFNSVALGLCLVPMAVTLVWVSWANRKTADQQLLAILGGTSVRMCFVLGAGLLLTNVVPIFVQHQWTFWVWLLVFYLVTLGLEIVVLVRGRDALETQQK